MDKSGESVITTEGDSDYIFLFDSPLTNHALKLLHLMTTDRLYNKETR
jgi:hypothetical protein